VVKAEFEDFCMTADPVARRTLRRWFQGRVREWGVSTQEFEDSLDTALQNAFVAADLLWHEYDPTRGKRLTWFLKLAQWRMTRALGSYRRHAVQRGGDVSDFPELSVRPIAKAELRLLIDGVLSRMKPAQAEALRLHYLEGYPVREVAAMMDVTAVAVQSLLQRGRMSMRRLWTADDMDGGLASDG